MLQSKNTQSFKFGKFYLKTLFWFVVGTFLAAFAIEVILIPNRLIDGGIVGVSMMASHLSTTSLLPIYLVIFNLPFVILAYRLIGRHFVIQMLTALFLFAAMLVLFPLIPEWLHFELFQFHASDLEVIVLGGFVLGIGLGLIIRNGGSTDGTEIMGIIVNRKRGFSVGQVILASNIVIFAIAGFVYQNWHTAFMSLMLYVVATKVMDMVIVGFEDTKSVMIISTNPQHLADVLMNELGIGLTVMYGRGGFTGDTREILYAVVERLQLAELKELVHREDPEAFIAIENLHEVINGRRHNPPSKR
ncbi:MAG: YitT family protein [Chlamydiales bacterium]